MPGEKQAEKPTTQERLKQITDKIEAGIRDLFASDQYRAYLSTMSRFHQYSFNNSVLIYLQNPKATRVASYTKWKDSFGRQVKRGEHGITIIAPTPYKKKVEEVKTDPDTKLPLLDKDGREITEERIITIPYFKPVFVFDVSQTEGRPLPQIVHDLTGNVEHYEAFLEAMKRSSPVPVLFDPDVRGDGFYSSVDREIHIREGMSEVQTVCALAHEMAHASLHNTGAGSMDERDAARYERADILGVDALYSEDWISPDKVPEGMYRYSLRGGREGDPGLPCAVENGVTVNFTGCLLTLEPLPIPESGALEIGGEDLGFRGEEITAAEFRWENRKDRRTQEVEAESVSYAVCQYYGIETAANSFGYIAEWSKSHELRELKDSLETINRTAAKMIGDIDRNFSEICKERGIVTEERAEEPAPEDPARAVEDAFRKAPDKAFLIYQLREDSPAELRFMGLSRLQNPPDKANYAPVYVGSLNPETDLSDETSRMLALEDLYSQFNADEKPEGYTGHSLSVSDVIALKNGGAVSYHYCDSVGFRELPDFIKPENYLRNAELQTEDDPGMIDGIINNGRREQNVPETEKRVSVMAKLREAERKPKPPKKAKETKKDEPHL